VDLTRLGTAILLKPGIISGGPVTHECPTSRSIGYFLEPIIMLGPFSKKILALTLRGITTDDKDLSVRPLQTSRWVRLLILLKVDLIRTVTLPHLEPFGISDGLELNVSDPFSPRYYAHPCPKIRKRGSPPLGGGEVLFLCPIVKQVKTLNFVEPGKIKRIRGIAYAGIILA
jgi:RNA 3'-terminal phosphate cyclase-like protein